MVLAEKTGILIYTRGDLDTMGVLLDSADQPIIGDDDGGAAHGPLNFLIWRTLDAGTYYVQVTGKDGATGAYVLQTRTIADTTGISDAQNIGLDDFDNGLIDPLDDEDYFSFTLTGPTAVVVRTTHAAGVLLDDGGEPVTDDVNHIPFWTPRWLAIRADLAAGTYYVKVTGLGIQGPYALYVDEITEPGGTIETAIDLDFNQPEGGAIDPATDTDYFRIVTEELTHVDVSALGYGIRVGFELLDSDGNEIDANLAPARFQPEHLGDPLPIGYSLRDRLQAGTHYLKVTNRLGTQTGPYVIVLRQDTQYTEFLDLCRRITTTITTISDPLYGCQWNLDNSGQITARPAAAAGEPIAGLAGEDINVEGAWTTTQGANINVAMVDDGMHYEHEDLIDNVDTARNHDYSGLNEIYRRSATHGTRVAGIIAARDNSLGVRGVAPRATIYGYNVLWNPPYIVAADVYDAMAREAATTAVSNNSWGQTASPGLSPFTRLWEMTVESGITTGFGGKGVSYVWAAGNGAEEGDNANFDEFVNHYGVTAVCSVNDQGERPPYSEEGANLWICAPSHDDDRPGITTTSNHHRYTRSFGGTSAAAPAVSGVVALMRAANTDLNMAGRQAHPGRLRPEERRYQLRLGDRRAEVWLHHGALLVQPRVRVRGRERCGGRETGRDLEQRSGTGGRYRVFDRERAGDIRRRRAGHQHHRSGVRRAVRRVRRGECRFRHGQLSRPGRRFGIAQRRSLQAGRPPAERSLLRRRDVRLSFGYLPLRLGEAPGREPRRDVDAPDHRPGDGASQRHAAIVEPHCLRAQQGSRPAPHPPADPSRRRFAGGLLGRSGRHRGIPDHVLRPASCP